LADFDEDLIEMGVVIIPTFDWLEDPDVVSAPDWAWRLPIKIDWNHNPWSGSDHLYWFSCLIIEVILILVMDENIMTRMTFVLVAIEEVVAMDLIPTSLFSSNVRMSISL
jgi:hypothetical protein